MALPPPIPCAYIAIGSNVTSTLGDPAAHVAAAFHALDRLPRTRLTARSSIFSTDPVGPQDQDRYLNAVAQIETTLPPLELLTHMLAIERSRGRDRAHERRWGPRTLDLDLLLYADQVLSLPSLTIPHPRMHERTFVLEPLAELAPDLRIPGRAGTVHELLLALRGR